METSIAVFRGKGIRKTINNNEWWFSVADVVEVLTDSTDPRQYIKKMRQRDSELNSYWGTICTPLRLKALDGKMRKTNCASTELGEAATTEITRVDDQRVFRKASMLLTRVERLLGRREKIWNERPARRLSPLPLTARAIAPNFTTLIAC